MSKIERETVARWIVRQRKDGTKYWDGRIALDEGRFDLEVLNCVARDFPVGTVIICREPFVDIGEVADIKAENEKLRKIAAHVPGRVYIKAKEDAGFPEVVRAI